MACLFTNIMSTDMRKATIRANLVCCQFPKHCALFLWRENIFPIKFKINQEKIDIYIVSNLFIGRNMLIYASNSCKLYIFQSKMCGYLKVVLFSCLNSNNKLYKVSTLAKHKAILLKLLHFRIIDKINVLI